MLSAAGFRLPYSNLAIRSYVKNFVNRLTCLLVDRVKNLVNLSTDQPFNFNNIERRGNNSTGKCLL